MEYWMRFLSDIFSRGINSNRSCRISAQLLWFQRNKYAEPFVLKTTIKIFQLLHIGPGVC